MTENLTDSQLYQKCKKYGGNARLWMRKFEGLLPEVCRRRLYRRRGFASIHEFAAKLAGMSHAKVNRILQLSRKLEDKPKLREVFENGEASYSKVARVAYVAKSETDEMWAEKVKTESQFALNLSVNEERGKNKSISEAEEESVFKHTFQSELPVGAMAGDEVGDMMRNEVGDEAEDSMRNEAGDEAGDEVGDMMRNEVGDMAGSLAGTPAESAWAAKASAETSAEPAWAAKASAETSTEPAWTNLNFHIAPEVERKFRALKQKLEKQSGETMNYGEVLAKLMEMASPASPVQAATSASPMSASPMSASPVSAETTPAPTPASAPTSATPASATTSASPVSAEKQIIIKVCPDCAEKKAREAKGKGVPVSVKRLVLARQDNRCARAHCTHPPAELHHTNGYALTKSHSPEGLEYLCEKHHKLAHAQHEFVQVYRRE